MIDSYLSVILVIAGVAAGVWLRPRLIVLWRKFRNQPQSDATLTKKIDGTGVSDPNELVSLNRDCLDQIKQINAQLSKICKSIDQAQSALVSEHQQATQQMNTGFLKLLSSNESFANALQGSLQRNLDALNIIADQAESRAGFQSAHTSSGSSHVTSDGREQSVVAKVSEKQSFTPFDELIDKIKVQVNQASCKGFKNIQIFLEQLREKNPIELDSPSDQVFILFAHNAKSETTGKAFVMPGSYLGRPWVDWFEMPKGVFERVEGTVEPATVARDANGSWNLVKSGSLSQQ